MKDGKMISIRQQSRQLACKEEVERCDDMAETNLICCRCGYRHTSEERYCPNCGLFLQSCSCPHCSSLIDTDRELCPHCGWNLISNCCSFCGTSLEKDAQYCSECGNPRNGIRCPECATLNFRNFCITCNLPLNNLAQMALREARKDVRVQHVMALTKELDEIAILLSDVAINFQECVKDSMKDSFLTIEDRIEKENRTIDKDWNQGIKAESSFMKKHSTFQSLELRDKNDAIKKYKEKTEELRTMLNTMLPDTTMTPQMQRDYQSARKIAVWTERKVKVPLYWQCKAYNCCHKLPNECTKPYLGGEWIYEEKTVVEKEWSRI